MKKLKFALDLYKSKKASLGYCASIADMPKEDFIQYLGENGISIFSFESEQEFLEEIEPLKTLTEAENDVKNGRVAPVSETFDALKNMLQESPS